MKDCSPLNGRKVCDKTHFQTVQSESSDAFSDQSPTLARPPVPPGLESSKPPTDVQCVNEEDVEALGAAAPPLPAIEDPKPLSASVAPTASKTESPSRKKGGKARVCWLLVHELGALSARLGSFSRLFRTRQGGCWTGTAVAFSLCPFADGVKVSELSYRK